jgi:hypothetical protein
MTTVHGIDPQCLIWDGVSWSVGEVERKWRRLLEVWNVEPQRCGQQDDLSGNEGFPR